MTGLLSHKKYDIPKMHLKLQKTFCKFYRIPQILNTSVDYEDNKKDYNKKDIL